jgi:hypothetical protein
MGSGSGRLRQSAEELALKKGDPVTAVVKATEVMISKERSFQRNSCNSREQLARLSRVISPPAIPAPAETHHG